MKKRFILFLLIMCISVCFTSLLQKEKEINEYSIKENIELAIYLEDEQTNTIPSKESGYYYDRERSSCTNDAYINWDSVSWSPVVNNMSEYKTRCELYFTTTYTEGILNGTDPVLKDGLVPVTIEENGTVKKANLESEWYSYANKNWANSVILDDQYDTLNSEGKVVGATKEEGYVSFDGIDDYINLGLENYDFSNGISISLIFSLQSIGEENIDVIGNWENSGVGISVISNRELRASVYDSNNKSYVTSYTGINLDFNKYYSVTLRLKSNTFEIYVDGNLASSATVSSSYVISRVPIFVGANPQSDGIHTKFSNIDVKQVQIYNRALEEEEIKKISTGIVVNNEGLLRYVDFTNKSYEDNEIIPEEQIESYFVWIPKYRYQLWDLGNYDSLTAIDESKVHEIPLIFGDYNTSDEKESECTTPMESGASGNCQVGDYMTHPAFISIPSTGFWVGKFETGYDGATSVAEAQQNVNDSSKVIIKPNVISWRSIQIANAFYSSYNYQRNLDSHMMKNSEWGAVAYLGHSAYGSSTSVRINNNSDYITGYQGNIEPTCGYTGENEECNKYCNDGSCNTAYPNSGLASTTGNITGIYDMSGGAWEYVMGVMIDQNGKPMSGRNSKYNSGFNGTFGCPSCDNDTSNLKELTTGVNFPDTKYYEKYVYSLIRENWQSRILGDATGEMGPFGLDDTNPLNLRIHGSWYADGGGNLYVESAWQARSSMYTNGMECGIFTFGTSTRNGAAHDKISFRITMTPV